MYKTIIFFTLLAYCLAESSTDKKCEDYIDKKFEDLDKKLGDHEIRLYAKLDEKEVRLYQKIDIKSDELYNKLKEHKNIVKRDVSTTSGQESTTKADSFMSKLKVFKF